MTTVFKRRLVLPTKRVECSFRQLSNCGQLRLIMTNRFQVHPQILLPAVLFQIVVEGCQGFTLVMLKIGQASTCTVMVGELKHKLITGAHKIWVKLELFPCGTSQSLE